MPRLGVLGTMVWDTIYARDPGRELPVEEWGGISYALSALDAAPLPDAWSAFPIVKIGEDLSDAAFQFLRGLERVRSLQGVRVVPEPNNRVELRYLDAERRCERLVGGVPGWSWEELEPLARTCDALYVNFIAGWEIDLFCARRLRAEFPGPLYADIHSLLLGVGRDGVRSLRRPKAWREWIACFDIVQLNEEELAVLAEDWGDPWALAADVVGSSASALLVTLGSRGAAWVAPSDVWREGLGAISRTDGTGSTRVDLAPVPVLSGRVPADRPAAEGDPTGCGDVWGITCFASLLGGSPLEEAMRQANRMAARNARYRGTRGLARALRSETGLVPETGGER